MKFQNFLIFLSLSTVALSPVQGAYLERPDESSSQPLSFGLTNLPDDLVVSTNDRYLAVTDGDDVVLIDTATFERAALQPETLDANVEALAFLPNSTSLFAWQSNGSLTRLLAEDPLSDLLNVDLSAILTGEVFLASDPEQNNHLYFFEASSDTLFEYGIATQSMLNQTLVDTTNVTDFLDMLYLPLPAAVAGDDGGEADQLWLASENSRLLVYSETLNLLSEIVLNATHPNCPSLGDPDSHNLVALAASPDRSQILAVNATDNVVHVVDAINLLELDGDPNEAGINPICLHQLGPGGIDQDVNSNLRDIATLQVRDPANAPRAFLLGDAGISVINLTTFEIIDMADSEGQEADLKEPIALSSVGERLIASSDEDATLYTVNTDRTVSVISDNPFVRINTVSPDSLDGVNTSFSLTFEVDEVCTGCAYRVYVGGDIDESGTFLFAGNLSGDDGANETLSTDTFDISGLDSGVFVEGTNTLFLFVEDLVGNIGRDSASIVVDTPPPDVNLLNVDFGNQQIFATIQRLDLADIDRYNFYIAPASDPANPTCPGALNFSSLAVSAFSSQVDSGETIRVTVPELTNNVAYCVGVQAQDITGNVSANITIATEPVVPEATVGILALAGESGCALSLGAKHSRFYLGGFLLVLGLWLFRQSLACLER